MLQKTCTTPAFSKTRDFDWPRGYRSRSNAGAALERQVRYSTQKAQDQKDSFLLEVQDLQTKLVAAVASFRDRLNKAQGADSHAGHAH